MTNEKITILKDKPEVGCMYRKRRLKKIATRLGLDLNAFRAYCRDVKAIRRLARKAMDPK